MVCYVEHNRKSRLTVKGKGQGHESIENHHFYHNFGTKCRRGFWLMRKCSEYDWLQLLYLTLEAQTNSFCERIRSKVILTISVCSCLDVHISVYIQARNLHLFSLYRSQFSPNNSEKIHMNYVCIHLDREFFSDIKVKGQGQCHQKVKNHLLVDNLITESLRRSRFFAK